MGLRQVQTCRRIKPVNGTPILTILIIWGTVQYSACCSGWLHYLLKWVSDCCLTPTQQFVSYIMARTS
jgi:hypothetical protein